MPRLVVNPGTEDSWEIELNPGTTTLGRSEENDIPLEHSTISSSHCQITLTPSGALLKDLGSTNGTFVDSELVEQATLRPGQRFCLGGIEMEFQTDAPAEVVVETPPPVQLTSARPAVKTPPPTRITSSDFVIEMPPPVQLSPAAPKADGAIPRPPPIAPPISPPMAPPVDAPAVPPARAFCKMHPRTPARYSCPKCHYNFCDLCVNTRATAGSTGKFCRVCGVACATLEVRPILPPPPRSFSRRLGGAFTYPFKGDGPILLATGTIFYWLIAFARDRALYASLLGLLALIILGVFGTGYLTTYLRRILTSSAMGEETMPDWPDASDIAGDIVVPFLQLLGTILACFLPALGVAVYVASDHPSAAWALVPAWIFGCAYFPMAFLAVSMFDSIAAVNPLLVIPSIVKIPWSYALATVLFGAVLVVYWFGDAAIRWLLPIPILPSLILRFISLYVLTVLMRLLGLLYLANKSELGWFNRV